MTSLESRMRALIGTAFVVAVLALLASSTSVVAKPEGPVQIEYSVPAHVKKGDEVTTVLTLRPVIDVDRLDVTVAASKGLEVISERKDATFTGVKRGDTRQFTVTIRLTEEPFGYLSVTYVARTGPSVDGGATMVVYGSKDAPK